MSNPQRFLVAGYDGWMQPFEGGDYVKYEDYHQLLVKRQEERDNRSSEIARLKAEVERLDGKLARVLRAEKDWVLVEPEEYARLKASVDLLFEDKVGGNSIYAPKPNKKGRRK